MLRMMEYETFRLIAAMTTNELGYLECIENEQTRAAEVNQRQCRELFINRM